MNDRTHQPNSDPIIVATLDEAEVRQVALHVERHGLDADRVTIRNPRAGVDTEAVDRAALAHPAFRAAAGGVVGAAVGLLVGLGAFVVADIAGLWVLVAALVGFWVGVFGALYAGMPANPAAGDGAAAGPTTVVIDTTGLEVEDRDALAEEILDLQHQR